MSSWMLLNMAKLTTLQFVQRALSRIDSENVSSVDETVESEQVKLFLDEAYEEIIADYPWFHLRTFDTLEVTATAHVMKIPDDIETVDGNLIRYNDKDVWYVTPERMEEILSGRDTSLSDVDANGALTNRDPAYWTTEDDENIIFDSYDGSLVSANSRVRMVRFPTALNDNTDVPDLPDRLHITLQHRVYELCLRFLKGDEQGAQTEQRKYIKSLAAAKRWARKVDRGVSTWGMTYGRKSNTSIRRRDIPSRFVEDA